MTSSHFVKNLLISKFPLKTAAAETSQENSLLTSTTPYFYVQQYIYNIFIYSNKDAVIETYLSWLEERSLDVEIPSERFNNLTKDERNAMYNLKDDKSIIIKGADKVRQ